MVQRLLGAAARARNEDQLLSELALAAQAETRTQGVDLLLVEGDELVLRASTIGPEYVHRLRVSRQIGLGGQVFSGGVRAVIPNSLQEQPDYRTYFGYDEEPFESAVIEPLQLGGEIFGAIYFRRQAPWSPRADELELTSAIAGLISGALQVFRMGLGASAGSNRRIGAVSQITDTLTRSPYLEEILQLLVNVTAQQFNYKVCTVRLLDEQNQELVLRATQATVRAYQRKRSIKLGESIAGRAIVEQRHIVVRDVQAEPDYIGHDLAVEQGLRSMICLPLTIQGRAVGVLTCYTDQVRDFEEDEVAALEAIASQAAVTIEHAKLQVRTTLMQEMHHRVKNNLQHVVSLLRLQLRHKHYKNTEEAINDSLSRILAIASVHDLLSREDLDHVGIRSIAEVLVHHQQQSFISPEKQIRFEVRGEDVRLNMTQATQVALVLNELIQNAVEHGFGAVDQGDIHINIETRGEQVALWVSNNGSPLPTGFEIASHSHLGLQIVSNLARGLSGELTMEDRLGWCVSEVVFHKTVSE